MYVGGGSEFVLIFVQRLERDVPLFMDSSNMLIYENTPQLFLKCGLGYSLGLVLGGKCL